MPLIIDPSTIQELRAEGVDVYDFSSISTFLTCPKKFYFRHELGLTIASQMEPSYALEFGRSIHKALEHWYQHRKDDDSLLVFAKEFKEFEEKPSLSPKTGKELDATYTVRFGLSLLDAYFTRYRDEHFTLLQNEIPVAEELTDGVFIAGRIDKVLQTAKNKLIFRDHKTSKYMDKYRTNPSPQFMGYKFLCEKLTGEHVSGELDMLGVAKNKPLDTLLRREPFDYTRYQMEMWKESIIYHIKQIRECRVNTFFPRYWRCQEFFKDCMFVPLCTLASADEEKSLVANLYKVEFWDAFATD